MTKSNKTTNNSKLNGQFPLIILFVFILGFGAGTVYQKSSQTESKLKQETQYVDMSNWQTYSNTKYGYTFQYPSTALIEEEENSVTVWESKDNDMTEGTDAPPSSSSVNVTAYEATSDLDTLANSVDAPSSDQKFISKREVTLNGMSAYEYTYEFIPNGIQWHPIYLQVGENVYRVYSQDQIDTEGFAKDILSTFTVAQ